MALEIVQILASGTFGHVAVVRDTERGDLLAAKVLKEAHAGNPRLIARLHDEATLLARLDHPHIVGLEELREVAGRPVLLMEWVRGVHLASVLSQQPNGLDPANVCEVVRIAADALDAAWNTVDPLTQQPIHLIHRDLKPSNIVLSVDGVLKLIDFGIAKGSFSGKESETVSVMLGAHGYLSPERLDGADDEPAGDVFALGCVFFELLTGRKIELSLHPAHHAERMSRHLMHLRPPGVSPQIVHALSELIARMAAYEIDDRPTHPEIVQSVSQLMLVAGWQADLPRVAERDVVPLLQERPHITPHQHTAFPDLAFLETPSGHTPTRAPVREADTLIREFLTMPGWQRRTSQLKRMLAVDPSWTPAPFLEILDQLRRNRRSRFWPFGQREDREDREQLVVILEVLRARPDGEVRRHAWRLTGHNDPQVSALARQVYVA